MKSVPDIQGWMGGAMVLGKLPVPGRPTNLDYSTGRRPVVAVFCNILFSCNRHIVLSDSIFWFNKLGVNVGIFASIFFK